MAKKEKRGSIPRRNTSQVPLAGPCGQKSNEDLREENDGLYAECSGCKKEFKFDPSDVLVIESSHRLCPSCKESAQNPDSEKASYI
jgi:hypothetical protein